MVWWNDHSISDNDWRCVTEHCDGRPVWRLDVDGVVSLYCADCKDRLDGLDPPLSEAETQKADPAEKKTTGN